MIIGIGIDSVEIDRFEHWNNYSDAQLVRIFSQQEIDYCRSNLLKSAERFAVRFASREAFFKAVSPHFSIPFLRLCKAIQVTKNCSGKPEIKVDWKSINIPQVDCTIWLSLTHTKTVASAMIILENTSNAKSYWET